jgi:hypothetical protein
MVIEKSVKIAPKQQPISHLVFAALVMRPDVGRGSGSVPQIYLSRVMTPTACDIVSLQRDPKQP